MLAISVATAVVATPFAAHVAADAAHSAAVDAQRSEAATLHEVKAVLLRPAPSSAAAYTMDDEVLTQAAWTSRTGVVRTGQVMAPPGAPRGTVVGVWTDAAGHLADSPLTDDQVAGQADLAETGTIIGMAALFGCEMLIVRRVINRRRMAAWDADWAVTGPAWNRQRW